MRKLLSLMLAVMLLAACGTTPTATNTPVPATAVPAAPTTAPAPPTAVPAPPTAVPVATTAAPVATTAAPVATTAAPAATTAAPAATTTVATTDTAVSTTTTAGATGTAGGAGIRVGLVTDVGKVNDGTFNQSAYEGLQRAAQELGVTVDFVETQQPTDYETNLDRFASQGYDLVIGVGFLMGEALQTVAARYPDVKFAIVDFAYEAPPENVKGLVFREDQGGYLAGTMAALVSKSNNIGVVGGIEQVPAVKAFVDGYAAGAKAQKPDIRVQQVFVPSFTAPDQGAEQARSQIAEGADVIFGAGGQTGSGGIAEAAKQGAYVIGVDKDEYLTTFGNGSAEGADRIVTSALKRVDNAVFAAVQSVVDGSYNNELYVGDAANGGIDYADAHDASAAVTADVIAKMDEVKAGLADGTIKTGLE